MYYYYPSCTFRKTLPDTAELVIERLRSEMSIMNCCRADRNDYGAEDTAVVICGSCRSTLESKMKVISLWEYLLQTNVVDFPDYSGLKVNVQDCWRDRDQPEAQKAIRDILRKMNIEVVEIPPNFSNADFCGTLHYDIKSADLAAKIGGKPLYELPKELQKEVMQERIREYSCEYVVCGCAWCLQGIRIGGSAKGIHLLELIFKTANLKG